MTIPEKWPLEPASALIAAFPLADRAGAQAFIECARARCRAAGLGAPVVSTRRVAENWIRVTIAPRPAPVAPRPLALAPAAWPPCCLTVEAVDRRRKGAGFARASNH